MKLRDVGRYMFLLTVCAAADVAWFYITGRRSVWTNNVVLAAAATILWAIREKDEA